MQNQTLPCQFCKNNIVASCYQIHKRACQRKIMSNQKKANKISKIHNKMAELIPCTQCGDMVDFSVFAEHMQDCVGRQLQKCPNCKLLYPIFLFEEHMNVCNQYREQEVAMEQKYQGDNLYSDESQNEQDQDLNEMIMKLANYVGQNNDPLTLQNITKLKKINTKKSQQCSICYCQLSANSQTFKLNCPHRFHIRCLTAWLQKNPCCPMCRKHVLS